MKSFHFSFSKHNFAELYLFTSIPFTLAVFMKCYFSILDDPQVIPNFQNSVARIRNREQVGV